MIVLLAGFRGRLARNRPTRGRIGFRQLLSPKPDGRTALGLIPARPARITCLRNAFKTKDQELYEVRLEMRNTHAELTTNNGITEVLFNLVGKMRMLLCLYNRDQEQGSALESALESAVAQLELQSLKIDYDALRQENGHLREVLRIKNAKGGNERV